MSKPGKPNGGTVAQYCGAINSGPGGGLSPAIKAFLSQAGKLGGAARGKKAVMARMGQSAPDDGKTNGRTNGRTNGSAASIVSGSAKPVDATGQQTVA